MYEFMLWILHYYETALALEMYNLDKLHASIVMMVMEI
jgi:hypothetical protein